MIIVCPWCKNKYSTAGCFNNHFYDDDLTDIHRANKNYSLMQARKLIKQFYESEKKGE